MSRLTNNLEIAPVTGAIGAEIGGLDLSESLSAATVLAVREALGAGLEDFL